MFKRFWWVFLVGLVIGPLFGAALGALAVYVMPKIYESTATVQIRPASLSTNVFPTEFEVIRAAKTLDIVVADLELGQRWAVSDEIARQRLASLIESQNIRGTDLISVRTRATNPDEAAKITNSVVAAYRSRRNELSGVTEEVRPFVIIHANAVAPTAPVSPNVGLLLLLGTFVGVGLGIFAPLMLIPVLHRLFPARETAFA